MNFKGNGYSCFFLFEEIVTGLFFGREFLEVVPNKQIFLTAFLREHPRLWTSVHRNTGQCRSEETAGCHPIQPLPQTIVKYSKFLRAVWSWALNICKNWDSTTSLGNLFQCWISLTVNVFVLISRQNFLCCDLWWSPLSFHCAPLRKVWHCPTLGSWWQELGASLPGFCTDITPCSALPFRGASSSLHPVVC